ncbi:MAG: translocation/assembly module TamB domain-containing protein, partial [Bacteroidota bacterium]
FEKNGPEARLNGQVEVTNRSYYNYFKKFEATGKLLFTGNALNPELDILGRYETVHQKQKAVAASDTLRQQGSETEEEKVLVKLEIKGTRNEPKLSFALEKEKDGKYERWNEGDEESNAVAFLLSGRFRDELTGKEQTGLITDNLLGVTSGVLSAPLREYLRRVSGVSLDVLYYGGPTESADVRLSGEIGEAVLRLGGRVLNNINNTNFSVELPMSSIVGIETWRNLIFTVERRVEGIDNLQENRASNGARLLYRINF